MVNLESSQAYATANDQYPGASRRRYEDEEEMVLCGYCKDNWVKKDVLMCQACKDDMGPEAVEETLKELLSL